MQASLAFKPEQVIGTQKYGRYTINIFDDSGNPTNGNNVQVGYQQVTHGVYGPVQYATIPGLSQIIFDGVVQDDSTAFITYFVLTGVLIPGVPGPPINPNLTIVSITIVRKADNVGGGGIVDVVATSSFLPIQYYIDDSLTSPDGNFINISGGLHTAKVVDASGSIVEQQFTMPKLDAILTKDPSLTINGFVSRWSACFNPIVFTYQRKDFDVTAITQDSTTLKPAITVNTTLTGLTVGDFVYLEAGLSNGLSTYKGAFEVLSFVDSKIIIDTDYIAPDSVSGFANIDTLRPYYKVTTKIKYVDVATGRFNTIVSTNRPINGVTKANLSSFLQSLLQPQPDLSNYTQVNYRDMGLGASYQVSYAESWEGHAPVFTDVSTPFYVTYAAKQLQQRGGGNMFDFVSQPGGQQLAKWLTDFVEPSYSTGFPFDLPFIYSERIAGLQLYYKFILLDYNRQPLGVQDYTTFLLNENSSYLLNEDGSKFVIVRQQLVNQPIVQHVGINRLLINQDFGPECWYINAALFYDNTGTIGSVEGDCVETTGSDFVDVNGQFKINDAEIWTLNATGTEPEQNFQAGSAYRFILFVESPPVAADPKVTMIVYKDDAIIYAQTIAGLQGASLSYTGIIQPGSNYRAQFYGSNGGADVTPVNIADNAPVTGGAVQVTENIIVKVDKTCPKHWVYIRWIGLNGAWNYYRFNYNQTKTIDIQNPVIIKDFVFDWENTEGIERVVSKDASVKLQLYADEISKNDIDGLQSVKHSPIVQVLISISPLKWQTIVVNSSTFTEYDTQNEYYDFGITFNYPSINTQSQ